MPETVTEQLIAGMLLAAIYPHLCAQLQHHTKLITDEAMSPEESDRLQTESDDCVDMAIDSAVDLAKRISARYSTPASEPIGELDPKPNNLHK